MIQAPSALLHSASMCWTIWTFLALATLLHSCPGEAVKSSAQVDCLARCTRPQMIKEMLHTLRDISRSLPNGNKRHRFLPKCIKKLDIANINKILEIYEEHVFKKLWNDDTEDPKTFTHAFSKLKDNVEHCKDVTQVSHNLSLKKVTKSIEKTFKKLNPDELWNAVADFQTVLHWIGFYIDKKLPRVKCPKYSENAHKGIYTDTQM